jgi:predicted 3-demethylubiquinone-9 3-methyltransferase (glyoxalase superfamily)
MDGPSGKAGSVLVVAFTLAGQSFLALNGGKQYEHTHAISFHIACADQAEVDRLWAALCDGGAQCSAAG